MRFFLTALFMMTPLLMSAQATVAISPAETRVALVAKATLEVRDAILSEDGILTGYATISVPAKKLRFEGLLSIEFPLNGALGSIQNVSGEFRSADGKVLPFNCEITHETPHTGTASIRIRHKGHRVNFVSPFTLAAK